MGAPPGCAFYGRFLVHAAAGLNVLLFASAAHADGTVDARTHYERGTAHYALGEFAEAAEEYQEAFRLKQDPAILYNAAQAYRLAGNREKAIILYRNYILLFPNEPNVDLAQEQIAKLKQAIADDPKSKPTAQPTKPMPRPNLAPTEVAPIAARWATLPLPRPSRRPRSCSQAC